MKKLKKDVYINLQGKSKKELTELYWLLKDNNQIMFRNELEEFLLYTDDEVSFLDFDDNDWGSSDLSVKLNKQEVTIQQLKEILQPMENKEFDLSMCRVQVDNKEQAKKIQELGISQGFYWRIHGKKEGSKAKKLDYPYYYFDSDDNGITYCHTDYNNGKYKVLHFNDIFKETLEQQLEKAKAEVKRIEQEIEKSKIKVGDWLISNNTNIFKYKEWMVKSDKWKKITDQELINKLNNLIK